MTDKEVLAFEDNELPGIWIDNIKCLANINKALSIKPTLSGEEINIIHANIDRIFMMKNEL